MVALGFGADSSKRRDRPSTAYESKRRGKKPKPIVA
jgi:hypothetical protein